MSLGSIYLSDLLCPYDISGKGGCVAIPDDLGPAEWARFEADNCKRIPGLHPSMAGDRGLVYIIPVRSSLHVEPSVWTVLQFGIDLCFQ